MNFSLVTCEFNLLQQVLKKNYIHKLFKLQRKAIQNLNKNPFKIKRKKSRGTMISAKTFTILPLVQVNLNETSIDIASIRRLCSLGLGVDSPPEDRAIAWLNLLSIYPANPSHWASVCSTITKSYRNFMTHHKIDNFLFPSTQIPIDPMNDIASLAMSPATNLPNSETPFQPPLNRARSNTLVHRKPSIDNSLMGLIKSDIERSRAQILYLVRDDGSECQTEAEEQALEMHMKRMERILYVFAKVNPQFSYIQGFNELIIPIYYVMSSAIILFFNKIEYVESIVYESFQFLLIASDLSDFFHFACRKLTNDLNISGNDNSYENKLSRFDDLLYQNIPKIAKKLKTLNIQTIDYAYRWFNIMFSQEHQLPILLPLWDSMLAHLNDLALYEYCVGVSRIKTVQSELEGIPLRSNHPQSLSDSPLRGIKRTVNVENPCVLGTILNILCNIRIDNIYELIKQANRIYTKASETFGDKKRSPGFMKNLFSRNGSAPH